jgi:hypothetical protein
VFRPKTLLPFMKRLPVKRVVHLPNVTGGHLSVKRVLHLPNATVGHLSVKRVLHLPNVTVGHLSIKCEVHLPNVTGAPTPPGRGECPASLGICLSACLPVCPAARVTSPPPDDKLATSKACACRTRRRPTAFEADV